MNNSIEQKLHDILQMKIHRELPMVFHSNKVVIGIKNLIDKKEKMINAEHTTERMFCVLKCMMVVDTHILDSI